MTTEPVQRDLIVLAADLSQQRTLEELLTRRQSLGIRAVSCQVNRHPACDSGVLRGAHEFLRAQTRRYRHALAVCDRHGSGKESLSRQDLETEIEGHLRRSGWDDRAAAVVIDPELGVWVWTDSPHVEQVVGWQGRLPDLWKWLHEEGFLKEGKLKPEHPKEAFERALRLSGKHKSSSLFRELASRVSVEGCIDPAFLKLKATLQHWFPVQQE